MWVFLLLKLFLVLYVWLLLSLNRQLNKADKTSIPHAAGDGNGHLGSLFSGNNVDIAQIIVLCLHTHLCQQLLCITQHFNTTQTKTFLIQVFLNMESNILFVYLCLHFITLSFPILASIKIFTTKAAPKIALLLIGGICNWLSFLMVFECFWDLASICAYDRILKLNITRSFNSEFKMFACII